MSGRMIVLGLVLVFVADAGTMRSQVASAADPVGDEAKPKKDPFGGDEKPAANGTDPFAEGGDTKPKVEDKDPFGGGDETAANGQDPFGGGAKPADKDKDPFAEDDPFGTGDEDPFGGHGTERPRKPAEKPKKTVLRPGAVTAGKPIDAKANEAKIRAALDGEASVEFEGTPLKEVVDFLRELHTIEIQLDRKALDEIGIEADLPITFNLKGTSLRNLLHRMLKPYDLAFVIRDEVLLITSKEVAETQLSTRVYDVNELLTLRPAADGVVSAPGETRIVLDYDSLINIIVATVAPDSWDEVGGPGSVSAFRGKLIVSQTDEVHRQVRGLLSRLEQLRRDAGKSTASVAARVLTERGRANEKKIRAALASATDFDFLETPLDEVVAFLAELHSISILIDTRALADAGVDEDLPITRSLKKVSLASALKLTLGQHDLVANVQDEVLLITTAEEAEQARDVRLYPVDDLLSKGSEVGDMDSLTDVITSTVSADSWQDVGGPGSINACETVRCLVICQAAEVHEGVEELLAKLRRKDAK